MAAGRSATVGQVDDLPEEAPCFGFWLAFPPVGRGEFLADAGASRLLGVSVRGGAGAGRTTFSAGFRGTGKGGETNGGISAVSGSAGVGFDNRANTLAPSTPKAMPPSTPSTHGHDEAGAFGGAAKAAESAGITGRGARESVGCANPAGPPPRANRSSSPHRPR